MSDERLSREEFTDAFERYGLTAKDLGVRWGKTYTWIWRLIVNKDSERQAHWDDAVRGLNSGPCPQLTAAEFKQSFRCRGWKGVTLAARWGKSPSWLNKIINDPNRDAHWNDAVLGLPRINTQAALSAGQVRALQRFETLTGVPPKQVEDFEAGRISAAELWAVQIAWLDGVCADVKTIVFPTD